MPSDPMLHDLMNIIRAKLGNDGFQRHGLGDFHHANACAAVDVLEDADLAIAYYLENESAGECGLDHLRTYGVLQAAFLQLHMAKLLRKAFGLPDDLPKAMDELRELRNRISGHPASTPPSKRETHPPATFIARHGISGRNLTILKIAPDVQYSSLGKSITSSTVDLGTMLEEHSKDLHRWMEELVHELQRREQLRVEDISARGSLSALMHPSWRWLLSKIHEASLAPDETAATLAQPSVPCLLKVLDEVETGLAERGIDPPHSSHVETTRAALDRLAKLLEQAAAGKKVQLDIAAFATLAEQHMNDIEKFLKENDERLKSA